MKPASRPFAKLLPSSLPGLLIPVVLAFTLSINCNAQAPAPDSTAIDSQAQGLLSKMSLEDKIKLIGGVDSMYTNAIPSIELPRFKMSDASVGVRTWGPTTAYAGGVALAATWDPSFARELGEGLGRDARARSVNFLLGPGVNIARSPVGGRNFEYLSEDPYLNGAMVVPYIQGVQSQGVVATVKHYALNDEEFNRHDANVTVDERTMREIYLPAFEAAVTRGYVDAVMDSYNLVNGDHATQNKFLNLDLLKGEWGFQGVLMSDWDATYDGVAAANNGLDLEMPSPKFMNSKVLTPAVKSGAVKESTIDDKVLRILRTELRYGFTTRPQFSPEYPTYSVADRVVALKGALESITLLKNENHFLPLDATKVKTIAVIGPDAWPAIVGGGGSSEATAFAPISLLTGIGDQLGPSAHVLYARGLPEMRDVIRGTHWVGGVKADTFPSKDFTGTPKTATQRNMGEGGGGQWLPPSQEARSVRYTTSYVADKTGKYLLLATAAGGDSFKVMIDGKQAVQQVRAEGQIPQSVSLDLSAGQTIQVQVDYLPYADGTRLGVGIAYEPSLISEDALKYAADADVVVLALGFNPQTEGEGHDRTFTLPWGQDALAEAILAANPHTVVTIMGGGGMDVERWIDKAPALLHLYYPGQEGGTAAAEVVFGKHNPEGKLPVSFDRNWEDNPSYKWYYGIPGGSTVLHTPGDNGNGRDYAIEQLQYGDKLMVGYRYWTTAGKHPLYPFGFGLSYTTFKFSNLKAPAAAADGSKVTVSFDVTNTGKVEGSEVAQLYVSDPSTKVDRPERELKGFEKVNLAPGQTKHVSIDLDARSFSYWSDAAHKWTIDPGKFVVRVGDSSENTPLSADVTLQ
jgi:beta-glucosidase